MVLLQFLEVIEVFRDYLWVKYLCHAFIMPSTTRNGITRITTTCRSVAAARARTASENAPGHPSAPRAAFLCRTVNVRALAFIGRSGTPGRDRKSVGS